MLLLKNFLYLFNLQIGGRLSNTNSNSARLIDIEFVFLYITGLVIGSIHLIAYTALFIFSAAYLTVWGCSDFEKLLNLSENRICQFNRGKCRASVTLNFSNSLISTLRFCCPKLASIADSSRTCVFLLS